MTNRPSNTRRTDSGNQQYVRGDTTNEKLAAITRSVVAASRNGNDAAVRALRRALSGEIIRNMDAPSNLRRPESHMDAPDNVRRGHMAEPSKRRSLIRAASKKKNSNG